MGKDNVFKKINWKKVLEYSLPAIATLAIILLVMIIKGIAPFGNGEIAYIDYNAGLVPAYTALWDLLHGKGNIFISYDLGAGAPLYASNVINSFLSPISWLIAIFDRSAVAYGVALLVIIKLILMATTSYICFKKFFNKVNPYMLLLFSLVWTFSGWTLVHISNIGWLDIMILLPLLLLSARKLVNQGKIMWFVIILSYMLLLSYYISYMVLVATVVIATVYIFTIAEKQNRKKIASSLFFAIFISLLISFVAFIPSCLTSLQGHRFTDTSSSEKVELYNQFFSKLSTILIQSLPVVFFIRLMCMLKKDKKNVLFFLLSFSICGIGLLIEPINKMWHTGSYYCYPFRYSFVLILIMIFASLYYINEYICNDVANQTEGQLEIDNNSINNLKDDSDLQIENVIDKEVVLSDNSFNLQNNNNEENNNSKGQKDCSKQSEKVVVNIEKVENTSKEKKKSLKNFFISTPYLVFGLIISIGFMVFLAIVGVPASPYNQLHISVFFLYLIAFLSSYLVIEILLRLKNEKFKFAGLKGGKLVFAFCILQIIIFSVQFVGAPFNSEYGIEDVNNCFNISTSSFDENYKLKDKDKLYNFNFANYTNYSTLQTWIHISSEKQYQAYRTLGYNTMSTVLFSSGGTIMTDILLGNKYVLSYEELDSNYYTKIDEFDYVLDKEKIKIGCYELNFTMKQALLTDVDLSKINYEKSNLVEVQNNLYKSLYNQTTNIMEIINYSHLTQNNKYILTVPANVGKVLYLQSDSSSEITAKINDKSIELLNGFNDLGIMQNDLNIEISREDNENFSNAEWNNLLEKFTFATFDISTFKTVHESSVLTDEVSLKIDGRNINISVQNTSNKKYLFVPYINLSNMSATINSNNAKVEDAICNFMSLEIQEGDNQITISYTPQYLNVCAIVTLIAVIVFIACTILNHFFKFSENKFIIWIGVIGASVILLAVGFLVYIKPFFNTFLIMFS